MRIFGLDRTAHRLRLTKAIAGLLDSSCIVFQLFICLSQNLVVRRDQRNQKKAYREDLGRRARPTQSKQCSRRRRLQSLWLKARHVYVLSQVNVPQHLNDLLCPNTLDPDCFGIDGVRFVGLNEAPHVSKNTLAHGGALVAREQGGEAADVVTVLLHALLIDCLSICTLCRQVEPRLCFEGD